MKTDWLETDLRDLDLPEPPESLRARCRATIPAPERTARITGIWNFRGFGRKETTMIPRWVALGAAAIIAGLGAWGYGWQHRHREIIPAASLIRSPPNSENQTDPLYGMRHIPQIHMRITWNHELAEAAASDPVTLLKSQPSGPRAATEIWGAEGGGLRVEYRHQERGRLSLDWAELHHENGGVERWVSNLSGGFQFESRQRPRMEIIGDLDNWRNMSLNKLAGNNLHLVFAAPVQWASKRCFEYRFEGPPLKGLAPGGPRAPVQAVEILVVDGRFVLCVTSLRWGRGSKQENHGVDVVVNKTEFSYEAPSPDLFDANRFKEAPPR